MSWRDNYRTASFRGAAFYTEAADSNHGRRQAVHEFGQRDVPYTEDMGRKARDFTINGYLIGKDYQTARDALIEACEQAGPGVLVHPYRGELTVVCRGLRVSESSQDGGMCRVALTFLEAGEQEYPRSVVDSVNAVSRAGNEVTGAARAGFIGRFLTTGFPAFVRDAAAARLGQIADFLAAPGPGFGGDIEAAAEFAYSVRELAADASDLVLAPVQLADRLLGVMGSVRGAYGSSAFSVLTGMFARFDADYSGATNTPSRTQQGANFNAMGELVRQVAISEASKAAVVTEFPSYQDAIAARDTLLEEVDDEAEQTTNDDAFVAITALRAEVVRGIPRDGQDLPQLVSYTPPATMPGLLVAYQLYGDASRETEIVARNRPRHPGFLTGGQPLEVLSDG